MPETIRREQETGGRDLLMSKLTDPSTSPEERISMSRELFPEERKREILARADKDRKGRPVRYFRLMSYKELGVILRGNEPDFILSDKAKKEFNRRIREIQYSLKTFLENEALYDGLETDFQRLCSDFDIEKYREFVQKKIPLVKLLKLHQIGAYIDATGATGLKSFSVGAPWNTPVESSKYGPGVPVVEFSIPSDEIIVAPSSNNLPLQEQEREVNTRTIKPEWVTDVYTDVQAVAERFFKDPSSVTYQEYQEQSKRDSLIRTYGYLGETSMREMLNRWKDSELMADLIPTQKMADLDGTNPDLQKPLIAE